MKHLLEKWKNGTMDVLKRYWKFLAIPLVVIILMITVVILDKPGQGEKDLSSKTGNSSVGAEDNGSGEVPKAEIVLKKDAVPEIKELMEAYFKARKTCDKEALSAVYGGISPAEELNQQITRMEEEVKFYQDYENLVCYTAPGSEEGDLLVYTRFDVKFRQAESLAPSLIVCYAKKNADGAYYLVAETDKKQSELMEEANQSDEVQKLAKEVNESLDKALKSDENLLAVYHTLMNQEEETGESSESESEAGKETTSQETEAAKESASQSSQAN
jgi:hypothetical protein